MVLLDCLKRARVSVLEGQQGEGEVIIETGLAASRFQLIQLRERKLYNRTAQYSVCLRSARFCKIVSASISAMSVCVLIQSRRDNAAIGGGGGEGRVALARLFV